MDLSPNCGYKKREVNLIVPILCYYKFNILCTINHKDTALNTVKELHNVECVNDTTIAVIDLAIELCACSYLMLDWLVFQCPQCVAPTMAAAATFALWHHYPEDTPAPAPLVSSCLPMA